MSRKRTTLPKRKMAQLEEAARIMEKAAADAFSALWYFQHDAWKGHSWGYTAIADAEYSLAMLRKLFPPTEVKS